MKNISTFQPLTYGFINKRKNINYRWLIVFLLTLICKLSWGQCFPHYYGEFTMQVEVGNGTTAIAMGDLNGDGRKDMVVLHESDHIVSVALAKAGGGFRNAHNIKMLNSPAAVAIGDFNGDHKNDIIVACIGSLDVKVLLNNTLGGFSETAVKSTPAGAYPSALAVSDFNGDGKLDVVVTDEKSARVRVMLGTGLGNFLPPNLYNVGSHPRSIAVGDIDSDGKHELVVANYNSNSFSVLYNRGQLGFNPAVHYNTGSKIQKVILNDFNGDGKLDLAYNNHLSSSITVMMNSGGVFATAKIYPVGDGPVSMISGDINGDGKPDLVVGDYFSHSISLLLNKGSGEFNPATRYGTGGNSAPRDVAICDGNADGKQDIVVVKNNYLTVTVLLQCECPNTPPSVVKPIPTLTATIGQQFSFTIPEGTFTDAETPANQLTYEFSGLPPGIVFVPSASMFGKPTGSPGTYNVHILVQDAKGMGIVYSVKLIVKNAPAPDSNKPKSAIAPRAGGRMGVEEEETGLNFLATSYPNPVEKQLTVDIQGAAGKQVRLQLMDVSGRTVIDRLVQPGNDLHKEDLDLGQKQTGLYLLKVSTNTETQTIKVLKR